MKMKSEIRMKNEEPKVLAAHSFFILHSDFFISKRGPDGHIYRIASD
jgi:hypothetical protein